MIQEIIDGMIAAIRTEYDKNTYKVYTESVEQGLKEPCFSILCLNPSKEKQVKDRYMFSNLFNVTYFPSSTEPIAECNKVCEILYDIFELIEVNDGYMRGSRMNGQVVDGVLHFQVNYSPFTMSKEEKINMTELEVNTSSKG